MLSFLILSFISMLSTAAKPTVKATNLLIFPKQGKILTKNTLIKAIHMAKKDIYLAASQIDDVEIISALKAQAAKKVNVQIMVGRHKGNAPLLKTQKPNFHVRQRGKSFIDGFIDMGAHYIIVDDRLLLFSGLPFTKKYLSPHGCRGYGYIVHDKAVISETERIFKMDWAGHRVIPKGGPVIWGPDNLRSQWYSKLKQAAANVTIVTAQIEDEGLVATLCQLAQSGVKVNVLTMAFKPQRPKTLHQKNCIVLRKNGVDLHYLPIKKKNAQNIVGTYIMIDQSQLMLNSARFHYLDIDTQRQFGLITMNSLSIEEFMKVFQHDWQEAKSRV